MVQSVEKSLKPRRSVSLFPCTLRHALCILIFALCPCFVQNTYAEDLELINRPVNTSGLTGLLFTTSPYTIAKGRFEIGASVLTESSTIPHYTVSELPAFSITAGIARDMELAIQTRYFKKTINNDVKQRGAGDTELSYKWNFLPQAETSSVPSLALIVTGIAPTGDRELNLGSVVHWGARFGLSAGAEIPWGDHVLGAYADGQMVIQDLSDARYRDRYGLANAGLILPISKYRNLQMFVEYNLVTGIARASFTGGDYTGITYGLRLVNERFNISFGTQFLHKEVAGFDNSKRIIGMMSVKF